MTTTQMTRYDRSMLRVMNDPRGRQLRATAARRRWVVVAHVALTTAIVALLTHFCVSRAEPIWAAVAGVVLLLPWMVAQGLINGATRGLLELRERALDERQLAERSQVLARAHRATTCLLAVAVIGLFAAGAVDGDTLRTYAPPALVGVLVVHFLMPVWVAGLTAKDEPTEDETTTL
ncbi:hypothetical protein SAMN04487981_106215 [Streptomyces sp. cf386]|uniref:hypothetical protein n=1 Tax=Streptomyces sp. cf386 TaxID=1761904 RepID=UPI00088B6F16|nr:hypothetical protein [Streptomyces sp. cf386]SDN69482.1 hypothetical protein SAMN04487981_106215 [Streptomyces sp. cf386]